MFRHRLSLKIETPGSAPVNVPFADLKHFLHRGFQGHAAYDETLARADGLIEAGTLVDRALLADHLTRWLRQRKAISPASKVLITEVAANP